MSIPNPDDLSRLSMLDLFRAEADSQAAVLVSGLLELEHEPTATDRLEELMRAAHCLKGAARIVNLESAVSVAHAMEDVFVAAQRGQITFQRITIDVLFGAVDLITRIARTPETEATRWSGPDAFAIQDVVESLSALQRAGVGASGPSSVLAASVLAGVETAAPEPAARARAVEPCARPAPEAAGDGAPTVAAGGKAPERASAARPEPIGHEQEPSERVLRVTAARLNRLLGLAGESLVESRWLSPFADSLLRLKRLQHELSRALDGLREAGVSGLSDAQARSHLEEALVKAAECRRLLAERLVELEMFDRRSANLSSSLYHEALSCRMRPFSDGLQGFPRMVRDVARSLGKEVRLEVVGADTQVDRDLLEKLEAPLTHLLRNALDHGLETPEDRQRAGKAPAGLIRLEARHSAGRLLILVADDGRGIPVDLVREAVVRRALTTAQTAARLSETELLEFLFLPGFSLKPEVTELSGRGVGLDIVQSTMKQVRGAVRTSTQPGQGTRFQLELPLTLSVMRTLLVEISGEPYAFPLAYLNRTLKVPRQKLQSLEGCQHFDLDGRPVSLVTAHQVLEKAEPLPAGDEWPVVIVDSPAGSFGLVVDRFLGERELVVHPLDPRLGKTRNISAGALMEDGAPVLIVDVEDLVRSIERLAGQGGLQRLRAEASPRAPRNSKRVLVVDDSLTVRELERKLLASRGYEVELAVDGIDGWNAARSGRFSLIITDIDMPRMDGIELVTQIKRDPRLKTTPTLVVSYKDREEDRRRGLEAGADYYLTKGSFHDDSLIRAVTDLIGEAAA